ncbi:MAG: SusC/RagA family TonB-linked outer membrane protein [Tannerellaceae bacterium]|nr:SusC/RagA family TonB-linked outer membrane protein [Tannerellaceae bacterium]
MVIDESGEPVIGANIIEKGTTNGVITDWNGEFALTVGENATLSISYIGYTSQEIKVANTTRFTIRLVEDTKMISEVVVTALGIKREEKALGYSIQKVSGEETTIAKGSNVATSLTGKVAGFNILNSPDFNQDPRLELRGVEPIIVIDGIHSENIGLRELAADDIESIEILKGGTASALYGEAGKNGAVMITTKRAAQDGVKISVNSNTMFHSGFLRLPKVQSSYSSGMKGVYDAYDECWGDKLDIGRTAVQYDPLTNEWYEQPLVSKGKDNLKNFMQNSFVTNNNVNVAYKGDKGSFRSSINHVHHKGVWPNNKENRFTYSMSGDAKLRDNLTIDASMSYSKRRAPQNLGGGDYGWRSYIYQMGVWTGADYDIRDFRNYWKHGRENEEQNWHYDIWYNNPYFMAYETLQSYEEDRFFGQFNMNWTVTSWFKMLGRVGYDSMSSRDKNKYPVSHRSYKEGEYEVKDRRGYSVKSDLIVLFDYSIGDFSLDALVGTSINYKKSEYQRTYTNGGLNVPGFFSLSSGREGVIARSEYEAFQTNSIYGKIGIGWRSAVFLEATGRNDWASTLSEEERSYFYPSVATSILISELVELPAWFNYWKLRGSWATSKKTPGYNDINMNYEVDLNIWNNANGASLQKTIRPATLKPESQIDWEVGTELYFLRNQLRLDVAYYQRLTNDRLAKADIPQASGFESVYVNMDETRQQRGIEITLSGDPVKTKDFKWTASVNWSKTRLYYKKIDPVYAEDYLWVHDGAPINYYVYNDWDRDPDGNMILSNGLPVISNYKTTKGLIDPDFFWGFTNHFRYKDWRLSVSLDGKVGGVWLG